MRALRGGGEWLRRSSATCRADRLKRNRTVGAASSPCCVFLVRPGGEMGGHLSAPAAAAAGDDRDRCPSSTCAGSRIRGVSLGLLTAGQRARPLAAGRADRGDRRLRRLSGCGARSAATIRSRSRWCSAARSATSLDRVRLGYVVDYADLHFGEWRPFLVFNVGDAAITIGVLLLLVRALLMRDGKAPKKESLTMRIAHLVLAASAALLLAGCARRRPVRPRAAPTSSRSPATRRWSCRPISR